MHRIPTALRVALLTLVLALGAAGTASADGTPVNLIFRGTGTIDTGPPGGEEDLAGARAAGPHASATARSAAGAYDRTLPQLRRRGRPSAGVARHVRPGTLDLSFLGINHFEQFEAFEGGEEGEAAARSALAAVEPEGDDPEEEAGVPFEPPDQGLCVGNGHVLESVNSALKVFSTRGAEESEPIDLAAFYGNPPLFDPDTGEFGTLSVDVGCYYDADARRFFHIALTLEFAPTGGPSGLNHLDIAVSRHANPLGRWSYYELPLQNNGTDGTPDDRCSLGFCLGDFPHIGADANGIYLTTNEFSFFGGEFHGANVYAISKAALARGDEDVQAIRFQTTGAVGGENAFGLWPAQSPKGDYDARAGGTEWLLNVQSGTDDDVGVWAVTNTRSLDHRRPALELRNIEVPVTPFTSGVPAEQKPGDFPLGQCINDTTTPTPLGDGCWRLLLGAEPTHDAALELLNPGDPRMQQVYYADGSIWAAHGVLVDVGGTPRDGVAFYEIDPSTRGGSVTAAVRQSVQFGVPGAHLIFPAVAVRDDGKGAMSFTLVGPDDHPSAGYAFVSHRGVGDVRIAAAGVGPEDGLSGYPQLGQPGQRWGDYSAAAVDGKHVWLATEYIAQTCDLAEYVADQTCDETRTAQANWATRISRVTP